MRLFQYRDGQLIEPFNGKPHALLLDFAYACGSPLNESDPYTIKSKPRKETGWKHVLRLRSHCKSWKQRRRRIRIPSIKSRRISSALLWPFSWRCVWSLVLRKLYLDGYQSKHLSHRSSPRPEIAFNSGAGALRESIIEPR